MSENEFNYDVYGETKSDSFNISANIIIKLIIAVVFIAVSWIAIADYNKLITYNEEVKEAYAQVQSNIQRKADLLPNLVKVVKAYTKHETQLLQNITKLRAEANKDIQSIQKLSQLNKSLNNSTLKLFSLVENYPDLKSSQQYQQLLSQIEGADNRINITRMQYNSAVKKLNASTKVFPSNIIASIAGVTEKPYFQADENAQKLLELEI